MLTTNSSPNLVDQGLTNHKLSFPNTSTGMINSNSTANLNSRYSPSNFYRAAAVAAVTSDPNHRRYMPNTPVEMTFVESIRLRCVVFFPLVVEIQLF